MASAADVSAGRPQLRPYLRLESVLAGLDSQRLLRWLMAVGLVSLATLPPVDSDLFWHLATGRWMLQHGRLPTHDVFSFSAVGHVWVVHEWLADVLAYAAYVVAGTPALAVGAALIVAAGFGFVFSLLRRAGASHDGAVILTMVSALAASTTWGARPQILNFLFLAALAWWLFRFRAGRGSLLGLPALFLLWANLHSGYVAGLGFAVIFAGAETIQLWRARTAALGALNATRLRRLWVAIFAAGLLSLLNPATYREVIFAVGTLGSRLIRQNIQEWASPDFHSLAGLMLAALIVVLLAGLLTGRVRADLTESSVAVCFLILALLSARHVPLFVVAAAPLLGRCSHALERALLGGWRGRMRVPRPRPQGAALARSVIHLLVLVAGAGLMISIRMAPAASPERALQLLAAHQPVGAAAYLQTQPPQDLFNYYDFGGYLIWALQAHGDRVFIDGRVEVYGDRIFAEYLMFNYLEPGWQEVLDRYRVRTVVMPSRHPVVGLLQGQGWLTAYRDDAAVVLERP